MPAAVFPIQDEKSTGRWSRQGLYRNETLADWLERAVTEFADEPAIVSPSGVLSYRDLYARKRGLAAGLQSLGLGKGDVIAIQLPNTPEFIISYLAITYMGGIVQTLHMPYGKSELLYLLNDSRAAAAICRPGPFFHLFSSRVAPPGGLQRYSLYLFVRQPCTERPGEKGRSTAVKRQSRPTVGHE